MLFPLGRGESPGNPYHSYGGGGGGVSEGRAAAELAPETLSGLTFVIHISGGPGPEQTIKTSGTQPIAVQLQPGTWNVQLQALRDGELYAQGAVTVEVKSGHNTPASIPLRVQERCNLNPALANGQDGRGSVGITAGEAADNPNGSLVQVTASPNDGYVFVRWARDAANETGVSTANPYEFTITGDTALYAVFVPVYSLTVAVVTGQEGRGTTEIFEGSATGNIAGTPVKIKAIENSGWYFIQWSTAPNGDSPAFKVDGVDLSSDNPCEFAINEDITLYAVFSRTPPSGLRKTEPIRGVSVPFRFVPGGYFQRDIAPGNNTSIGHGYWIAETETTQELFQAIMGVNPSEDDGGTYPPQNPLGSDAEGPPDPRETYPGEDQSQRPVESVNWYHAIAFCNKLSLAAGKDPVYSVSNVNNWATLPYSDIPTSNDPVWNAATMDINKDGYRLPTEMEWLWAAMGAGIGNADGNGNDKPFAGSDGGNNIYYYAWLTNANNYYSTGTHQVGKKLPNELGLYDMTGNVDEWCWDWIDGTGDLDSKSGLLIVDYEGGDSGTSRVYKGLNHNTRISSYGPTGQTPYGGASLRYHNGITPFSRDDRTGFRVVCTVATPSSSSPH